MRCQSRKIAPGVKQQGTTLKTGLGQQAGEIYVCASEIVRPAAGCVRGASRARAGDGARAERVCAARLTACPAYSNSVLPKGPSMTTRPCPACEVDVRCEGGGRRGRRLRGGGGRGRRRIRDWPMALPCLSVRRIFQREYCESYVHGPIMCQKGQQGHQCTPV